MDGARVRQFMENEVEAMLKTYEQFQILIPAEGKNEAAHPGEDGIYVEALLKGYIEKFLPKGFGSANWLYSSSCGKDRKEGKARGGRMRMRTLPSWI